MNFNKHADTYQHNAFIQKALIQWGTESMQGLFHDKNVLELGAGTGLLTRNILQQTPKHLTATDIAPKMIEIGKKNLPQVDWRLMDAWSPTETSFDIIASSSLLQWTPTPQETLRNWRAALNRKGSVLALFYIEDTLSELFNYTALTSPVNWRSASFWSDSFQHSGFQIKSMKTEKHVFTFESTHDLLRYLKTIGATTPNQLNYRELKNLLKNYDTQHASKNGVISTWNFCSLHAEAAETST